MVTACGLRVTGDLFRVREFAASSPCGAMGVISGSAGPTQHQHWCRDASIERLVQAKRRSLSGPAEIGLGTHLNLQSQSLAVSQAGNIGGLNLVFSDQNQNGIAGQVA